MNIKALLLCFLSNMTSQGMQHQVSSLTTATRTIAKLPPDRTIIAFDLDGVIIAGREEGYETWLKKGYTIIAASNMTTSTYQSLVDHKVLPPEFRRDFFFVQTDPRNKKNDVSYYKKPHLKYYENLLQYIENHYPGRFIHRIFTDDKKSNAEGAAASGAFKAIQFIDAQQLKKELALLGIELE